MNARNFSILKSLNCNFTSESYGFVFVDDLNYFYPADSDITIPIGDSYLVYTYEEDISSIGYKPDYRLRVDDSVVSIWKLD